MSHVLFYSSYCAYSKKFIKILEHSNEATTIAKVCIDIVDGKRPEIIYVNGITRVPTVIAEGQKLEGIDAFRWLDSKIKNSESNVNTINTRDNKSKPVIDHTRVQNPNELQAYAPGEKDFVNHCEQIGDFNDTRMLTPDATGDMGSIETDIRNISKGGAKKNSVKRDTLKQKQSDNDYNKALEERNSFDKTLNSAKDFINLDANT